jgi:hypothetical protein
MKEMDNSKNLYMWGEGETERERDRVSLAFRV